MHRLLAGLAVLALLALVPSTVEAALTWPVDCSSDPDCYSVPEPATWLLVATGLGALGAARVRRNKRDRNE